MNSGMPALRDLCACLGQIPAGRKSNPVIQMPEKWVEFSRRDWEQLVVRAQAEGLAPLLYSVLSRSGYFWSIGELARDSLRAEYSGTWTKNQKMFKELENLTQVFDQARISLVVIKGACFAMTIYPDIGLRPMGDLDLLVPGSKFSQAIQITKSFGYEEQIEPDPGPRDLYYHFSLQKISPPFILLELHKGLVAAKPYQFAVPEDWFWEQTEPMDGMLSKGQFENLRMLSPTAQLLYAAAHAVLQHAGRDVPLRWFYDIDRLVRTYAGRMDWDLLLSQAHIFEWGSVLEAALFQTVTCFDTPIPENVFTCLAGVSDRSQKIMTIKKNKPATYLLQEYNKLLLLNGSARFRYLLALIFPSPDYIRWRFRLKTSWAIPAYYVIRWWHVIKDGFRSLVSLFKKGSPSKNV